MADTAGSTRIEYEVANALGAFHSAAPRLARLFLRRHNYALAVQTYLRALSFYCQQHGVSKSRVRVETWIEGDRIVQRISG